MGAGLGYRHAGVGLSVDARGHRAKGVWCFHWLPNGVSQAVAWTRCGAMGRCHGVRLPLAMPWVGLLLAWGWLWVWSSAWSGSGDAVWSLGFGGEIISSGERGHARGDHRPVDQRWGARLLLDLSGEQVSQPPTRRISLLGSISF